MSELLLPVVLSAWLGVSIVVVVLGSNDVIACNTVSG